MKNRLFLILFAFLGLFMLSGCKSTRNTIQSEYKQSNEANLTIKEDAVINRSEAASQRTELNEQLTGALEFTRVEFDNGTSLFDIFPNREAMFNLWRYQYPNERTEPPDSFTANPGVKAITTGKFDLNKNTQANTENQTQTDTKQESSLNTDLNTTSEITNNKISIEKEKHGFFYFFGIFAACFAAGGILCGIIKFIGWLIPIIKKSK